jgi:hypothetical protein
MHPIQQFYQQLHQKDVNAISDSVADCRSNLYANFFSFELADCAAFTFTVRSADAVADCFSNLYANFFCNTFITITFTDSSTN